MYYLYKQLRGWRGRTYAGVTLVGGTSCSAEQSMLPHATSQTHAPLVHTPFRLQSSSVAHPAANGTTATTHAHTEAWKRILKRAMTLDTGRYLTGLVVVDGQIIQAESAGYSDSIHASCSLGAACTHNFVLRGQPPWCARLASSRPPSCLALARSHVCASFRCGSRLPWLVRWWLVEGGCATS